MSDARKVRVPSVTLSKILSKLPVDTYVLLLLLTVAIAAILPARGVGADAMGYVVYLAVALLFFLYGARLSTPGATWRDPGLCQ